MKDYTKIVIDKRVACAFIHQSAHLAWNLVPNDVKDIKIKLKTGEEITIGRLIEQAQVRVNVLANYIKLAVEDMVEDD